MNWFGRMLRGARLRPFQSVGALLFVGGLILWASFFASPAPLTDADIERLEDAVGIPFPESTSRVQTFLKSYSGFAPDLYVKLEFDASDTAGLLAAAWIETRLGPDSESVGNFYVGETGPSWFDALPLQPEDGVYQSQGGAVVVARKSGSSASLFVVLSSRADLPQELLSALKAEIYWGRPIVGPVSRYAREWP